MQHFSTGVMWEGMIKNEDTHLKITPKNRYYNIFEAHLLIYQVDIN